MGFGFLFLGGRGLEDDAGSVLTGGSIVADGAAEVEGRVFGGVGGGEELDEEEVVVDDGKEVWTGIGGGEVADMVGG